MSSEIQMTNIIVCGVGGQGILLSSDVLCFAAFNEGFDVKKSEIHGMAQRGGSVVTHVRFGRKVYSPLIEEGTADFILAYEKIEALRYAHFLKPGGGFVVNDLVIPPMTVLVGEAEYPSGIEEKLKAYGSLHLLDATGIAKELGNIRATNITLLGGLANFLDFKPDSWHDAIRVNVKEKFVEMNLTAFNRGRSGLQAAAARPA
jgi:indolepyruvate ferredoxin oxidoreductase beta subunit